MMVVMILVGLAGAFTYGASGKNTVTATQTQTQTVSTTTTAISTLYLGTLTTTQVVTSATTTTSTFTSTISTTTTRNFTTTATTTKVLGTGISLTDYQLYLTNVPRDSVFKFNLTINFNSNEYTYVNEIANVILFPSNGHQSDIRFVPNPVITQVSDFSTIVSMYVILNHQIVDGTYMIEFAVSTAQGSAIAYTVLEVTG